MTAGGQAARQEERPWRSPPRTPTIECCRARDVVGHQVLPRGVVERLVQHSMEPTDRRHGQRLALDAAALLELGVQRIELLRCTSIHYDRHSPTVMPEGSTSPPRATSASRSAR